MIYRVYTDTPGVTFDIELEVPLREAMLQFRSPRQTGEWGTTDNKMVIIDPDRVVAVEAQEIPEETR